MEITQVTTAVLEDEEINALRTLRGSYRQCITDERVSCWECPLYIKDFCIGQFAEFALDKQKIK